MFYDRAARICRAALLAVLACILPTATLTGQEPSARTGQQWVQQLGDDSFQARESATAALLKMGAAAESALREGTESRDAEVRKRSELILTEVLREEHLARVEAFAADRDGRQRRQLSGWGRYREVIGEDDSARGLFVMMHRAEPILMRSIDADSKQLSELIDKQTDQTFELRYRNGVGRQLSLGTVAALFYATSLRDVQPSEATLTYVQQFFINERAWQGALEDGPVKAATRKLLNTWVANRAEQADAYRSVRLAVQFGLPAGREASAVLLNQKDVHPQALLIGILALARFGDRQDVKLLRPLLNNKAQAAVGNPDGRGPIEVQVRDAALAAILHLSEEDLSGYGFTRLISSEQTVYHPMSVGFAEDTERERAFEKWAKRQGNEKDASG